MNNLSHDKREDKTLERVLIKYNDNSYLRTLITSIPVVGGPIDLLFSIEGQKISNRRTDDLIKKLQEQFIFLEGKVINEEFFKSETGFDLLIKTFNYSASTQSDIKRKYFARILKNAVLIKNDPEYTSEDFITVINDLSENEIKLATLIYEICHGREFQLGYIPFLLQSVMDKELIPHHIFHLKRLEASGLIIPTKDSIQIGIGKNLMQIPSSYLATKFLIELAKFALEEE